MSPFFIIALLVCSTVALLVFWPVLMHPTLPFKRRMLLSVIGFLVLVPLAMLLYAWLGVAQMAVV